MSQKLFRSLSNYISSSFKTVTTLLIGFVATPFLIKWLGNEAFGSYKLIESWLSFLGLLEFGIAGGLIVLMSKAIGLNKEQDLSDSLCSGIFIYLQKTALILAVTVILTFILPHFFEVKEITKFELQLAILLVGGTFLFVASTPFRTYLESSERSDLVHWSILAQLLTTTFFALVFSYNGFGLIGQSVALFLGAFFVHLPLILIGLKKFPRRLQLTEIFKRNHEKENEIKSLGKKNFILVLSSMISINADHIIVGTLLSPIHVVSFFVTNRLPQLAMQQLQNFTHSTWASILNYYHSGERDRFEQNFFEVLRFIIIIGGGILSLIAFFNQEFVSLWVGQDKFAGNLFSWFASIMSLLIALDYYLSTILKGAGKISIQVSVDLSSALLNVFSSLLLSYYLGLLGPILGSLIAYFYQTVLRKFPLALKHLNLSLKVLIKKSFGPLLFIIVFNIIIFFLKGIAPLPYNWFYLITKVFVIMGIYIGLVWIILLSSHEKLIWKKRYDIILNKIMKKP